MVWSLNLLIGLWLDLDCKSGVSKLVLYNPFKKGEASSLVSVYKEKALVS
jgi:hypothetical protein